MSPNCARDEPAEPNSCQRHTRRARAPARANRLIVRDFQRERQSSRSREDDRGWPCKTSIPSSNPGGASKFPVSNSTACAQQYKPAARNWTTVDGRVVASRELLCEKRFAVRELEEGLGFQNLLPQPTTHGFAFAFWRSCLRRLQAGAGSHPDDQPVRPQGRSTWE